METSQEVFNSCTALAEKVIFQSCCRRVNCPVSPTRREGIKEVVCKVCGISNNFGGSALTSGQINVLN